MLRIVTSNNTELFRHLGHKAFRHIGIEHEIAISMQDADERIRRVRPRVAILDAQMPGGTGYELCRAIKADPELRDIRVMIAVSGVLSRHQLRALQECGCDDVLALPVHPDDFYYHIAMAANIPCRKYDRVEVSIDAAFNGEASPATADVEDLSIAGLGARTTALLTRGDRVAVRLLHQARKYPPIDATVAWVRKVDDEDRRVGLAFNAVPVESRVLIEQLCLFDVQEVDGRLGVHLHGDLIETTDLAPLAERLRGAAAVDFNMREVRYISSVGVRNWCALLESLDVGEYSFHHASLAFVAQAAMMPRVVGRGEIRSCEMPYVCEQCDRDVLRLIEVGALVRDGDEIVPPVLRCEECGGELTFDDVPARYFAFLS